MHALVFGWDLILLSVHSDCCRGLGAHHPPLLPGHPATASFWLPGCTATPGLLYLLAPLLMTPDGHLDEILSYFLTPPGIWGCPWISIVLGGVWMTLSGHFLSRSTLSPFLHSSLFSCLLPSCSKAASGLGSRREVHTALGVAVLKL